jgi:5-methylcytosine-specific restriction endonuclease McrA
VGKHAGRSTRRYKRLRYLFKEQCILEDRPCWLCGQPIDYTLPHDHDDAFSLDHRFPVSTHPQYAEDPAAFEASHSRCNKSRGARAQPLHLGARSRNW